MEDKLQILYNNLVKERYDLPEYNIFKVDMSDPVKSKKLHDNLIGAGYELPDYDTFLGDMGLKKKDVPEVTGTPSEISLPEQPPLESVEEPLKRETTPFGDLLRTLKSSSLLAAGAILATPQMLNRTLAGSLIRPIVKSMGGTDEEAEFTLNSLTAGTPAGMQQRAPGTV